MALSGSMTSSIFGNGSFRLRLVWSATQNVSANTSTISTTLYLDSVTSWGSISDATSSAWNISIDGANSSGTVQSDVSGNGSKKLGTHTRTVSHSADGTKSLTISAGHTIDISWSGSTIGARSVSGSISLNTIARASTPTLSVSSVALGSAVTVNTNRASSSFTHTITYDFGGLVKTIATKTTSASVTYTTTSDLATKIPNSTSGWGNIWVETFNGSTSIGKKSVKLTCTVPSNATYNPTITTPTLAEANSAVTSAVGAYWVQKNSKVKVSATPTTRLGATVSKVEIKVKASSYSGTTITTGALGDSGAHTVTATVTDSRGRTATSSTSFTVTAYTAPRITSFKASRALAIKTNIETQGTASISAIGTANTATLKVSTSPKGKNTWTLRKTVTATSGTSITSGVVTAGDMPITNAFDVKLEIYDELNPTPSVQIISVGTAIFPMSWGKTGIGVGTVFDPSGSALQVVGGASIDHYVPQRVPASSNLDNYITPGFYYNNSDADTATIANTPTNNAFSLQVFRHAGFRQVFKIYATTTPWTYERNFYSGTWGRWCLTSGTAGAALPMKNGWGYYGGTSYLTPQYWLDGNDMVHLGGLIDYGTKGSGVVVAVLPVGFRPASREMFSTYGYQRAGHRIDVTDAGEVVSVEAPAGFISLSGISFRRDWYY